MNDSSKVIAWIVGIIIVGLVVWAIAASYNSDGMESVDDYTNSYMNTSNTNTTPETTNNANNTNLNVNASGSMSY